MNDDLISVSEIATRHGRHKHSLFKVLKRLGIETQYVKSKEFRGQAAAYISSEDYKRLKVELAEPTSSASDTDESLDVPGYFYIIQLEPSLDPGKKDCVHTRPPPLLPKLSSAGHASCFGKRLQSRA
jgi:hypothetical protein